MSQFCGRLVVKYFTNLYCFLLNFEAQVVYNLTFVASSDISWLPRDINLHVWFNYHRNSSFNASLPSSLILWNITLKGSAGMKHRLMLYFLYHLGLICPSERQVLPSFWGAVILTTITNCNVTVKQHNTWYGLWAGFVNTIQGIQHWPVS